MTDTSKKLREALQAISDIDDSTNHAVDASAALDRIGRIARQALALPTAEQVDDINVAESFTSVTKTAPPVGEREIIRAAVAAMPNTNPLVADDLIEGHTMHTEACDIVAIWRAALSAGDAEDAQRYRWLMENVVGFECCPPTLLIRLPEDVVFDFSNPSAVIDAAMRKGQL